MNVVLHLFVSLLVADAPISPLPTLQMRLPECVGVRPSEVITILELELHASVVVEADDAMVTRISFNCETDAVEVRAEDPLTRKALSRRVTLVSVAEVARPRLLALAVSELVFASWTELEWNPKPSGLAVSGTANDAPVQAVLAAVRPKVQLRSPPARVYLLGAALYFTTPTPVHWGGGVRINGMASGVGVSFDCLAQQTARRSSFGLLSVNMASVSGGLRLDARLRAAVLQTAFGARVGWIQVQGTPISQEAVGGSVARLARSSDRPRARAVRGREPVLAARTTHCQIAVTGGS